MIICVAHCVMVKISAQEGTVFKFILSQLQTMILVKKLFYNTILIEWLIGFPGKEIYSEHCVTTVLRFSHCSLPMEINEHQYGYTILGFTNTSLGLYASNLCGDQCLREY